MTEKRNENDQARAENVKPRFLKAFFDEETALDKKSWIINKYIFWPILEFLTKLHIPAPVATHTAVFFTLVVVISLFYLIVLVLIVLGSLIF